MKYLDGKASEQEREAVMDWVAKSEENRALFNRAKNFWVLSQLPVEKASREEVVAFTSRIQRKVRIKRLAIVAAAASIVLALTFGISYKIESYKEQLALVGSQHPSMLEYTVNCGVKGLVVLPDGTRVRLNSDSHIKCPAYFTGKTREIEFAGEGYFDVVKDRQKPMVIKVGNGYSVVVKGTTFNLSSYKGEGRISALLLQGEISIRQESNRLFNREVKVMPNEMVTIQREKKKTTVSAVLESFPTVAWKDGWLIFEETPMNEVIRKLERWYGVRIVVSNGGINAKKFTGKFKDESLTQILDVMEMVQMCSYSIKDTTVTLS